MEQFTLAEEVDRVVVVDVVKGTTERAIIKETESCKGNQLSEEILREIWGRVRILGS